MVTDFNFSSKDNIFTMVRILAKQKTGLKIVHINAQSLNKKIDEFRFIFASSAVDVICVSETWFDPAISDSIFNLQGFKLFRADRERHAGGVAIYVRHDIKCCVKLKSDASSPIEYLFLELIMAEKRKILLACVYRPHHGIDTSDLMSRIESLSLFYNDVIIAGDLNSNLLNANSLSVDMQTLGFQPVNNKIPTHYPNGANSLLDVFFVSNKQKIILYDQVSASVFSRHDLIFIAYDALTQSEEISYSYRDFRNINLNDLHYRLDCIRWNLIYDLEDVNDQTVFIQNNLVELYNEFVPVKTKIINAKQPQWFNSKIERLIAVRNLAYSRWKKFKTPELLVIFRSARKDVVKTINAAKSMYYEQKFSSALDCRAKWKNIREIGIGRNRSCTTNSSTDVNLLNNQFANIQVERQTTNEYALLNIVPPEQSFCFRCVNQTEVLKSLLSIKSNAEGLDGINPRFLKLVIPKLIPFLTHICNTILTKSVFPDAWKKAKIIPLPKNNNDFRPIAILPYLSKAMEKIMQMQISEYLNKHKFLTDFQSGFRQGRSCITVLTDVVEELRCKLDNDMVSFLVLLDHSKAFDTVEYPILLTKLRKFFSFSSTACKLISSYLHSRKQAVFLNGLISRYVEIDRGVPQGSILGPLLFSLYINDLPEVLNHCSIQMYADDVQLYLSTKIESVHSCINYINCDLDRIQKWASMNGLCINPTKSKCILISRNSKKIINNKQLLINKNKIEFVNTSLNLGITFNSELSWSNHISITTGKVHGMLRNLWSVQASTPFSIRMLLAKTYIIPVLLYGCEIFANCDATDLNRLEVTYNNIARYVFNRKRNESISPYSFQLYNMSFKNLLKYKSLLMMQKIIYLQDPEYLYRRLTFARSPRGKNLITQKYKYLISSRQFFIHAVSLWNKLPSHIQTQSNIISFKKELLNYFKFY